MVWREIKVNKKHGRAQKDIAKHNTNGFLLLLFVSCKQKGRKKRE